MLLFCVVFFFSSRRRHTRCALVTGVQTVLFRSSPVPLIATYEPEHVLCATTYSKSVLRVAATMLARGREWVDYYPSYEIITGSYNRSVYYESDRKSVV